MRIEPVAELVGHHTLYEGFRFGIAELGLGLAFELRGGEFHRHHCGQAFTHVVAGEVLILVFEDVLFTCVTVDERGQRGAEAFFVGAAFGGGDGVGEGVHRFGVCGGPLHGDFRGNADFQVFRFEIDHVRFDGGCLAGLHQVIDIILDAVVVLVGDRLMLRFGIVVAFARDFVSGLIRFAQIGQGQFQPLVEERHLLEAVAQGLEIVGGGFEDRAVCPEGHGSAGGLVFAHRLALGKTCGRLLVDVGLGPVEALSTHFDVDAGRQRVHHGDTHAVQTAGNRIAAATELAAGMQLGHHGFHAGNAFARHFVDRNASAVIHHAHAAVRQNRHLDVRSVACQRLIDGVVDDLVHQVVQASGAGGADVHARTDSHRLKAFQNPQIGSVVMLRSQGVIELRIFELIVLDLIFLRVFS